MLAGGVVAVAAVGYYYVYLDWQTQPAVYIQPDPIPLGAPPVDATGLLNLPVDPPTTAQECNEESLATAKLLLESMPERREAHAQMAFAYLQLGRDELALQSWRDAAACDENYADAYLGMGTILKDAGRNDEAITVLRRAIDLQPELEQTYRELIEALLREGQAEEAKPVAEEVVRRFPTVCENHFWLGQVYMQLKDYASAREAHEKAVEIDSTFTLSYFPLALACAHLGQPEEATKYRERFAEVKSAELHRDRDQALKFDDFLTQRQALVRRHVLAGTLQLQFGDVRLAEAHWVRAAQVNPDDIATRRALVSLYNQQNRVGAELKYLEQLTHIDSQNPQHALRRARLLIDTHAWPEARQALEQELVLRPDSAEAHLLLAETLLRSSSDLGMAETHAEEATRLAASSHSLFLLAAIRGEQGDRTGALAALKRALSLDPRNMQARQTYEQLLEIE